MRCGVNILVRMGSRVIWAVAIAAICMGGSARAK